MALRQIVLHPDPRLKKRCDPVADVTDKIRALADDMLETMYHAPGIGLAAPQVGINARLLVMDCTDRETEEPRPLVLINPEITWTSDETRVYEEGCLSIPDQFGDVTRPDKVRVSFTDQNGKATEEEFDDLWATCVQHEIDHLNGKLFIDHLSSVRRQLITQKMKKVKKERARG